MLGQMALARLALSDMQGKSKKKLFSSRDLIMIIEEYLSDLISISILQYNSFDMKSQNILLLLLLLVSTYSHLTTEEDQGNANTVTKYARIDSEIPDELKTELRNNVQKAIANLNNFDSGTSNLAVIKFELKNINNCLD